MISTRNTKKTASAVSFSAILSCEILDFGQQLSVCMRAMYVCVFMMCVGVSVHACVRPFDVCVSSI